MIIRGHQIEWDYYVQDYVYKDTGEIYSYEYNLGIYRPCKHCGLKPTKEGYDGCLGKLPGVIYACCGHGIESRAYIKWKDGVVTYFSYLKKAETLDEKK
jgi:hypothetical protein